MKIRKRRTGNKSKAGRTAAKRIRVLSLTVFFSIILTSCATSSRDFGKTSPARNIRAKAVLSGLEPGRFSGLASSSDGNIFLADNGGWRLQVRQGGDLKIFEITLPSARCLIAGGMVHGLCLVDQVGRGFIRYDQYGSQAFRAEISGHGADAFCLAPSGESVFLDADSRSVVFRDQGFRENRRWLLRGVGRPQALAVDLLEGLVVVAYSEDRRLDTYSILGFLIKSDAFEALPGPQSLAFDSRGRLWAAQAGGRVKVFGFSGRGWVESAAIDIPGLVCLVPGTGSSVLALGENDVMELAVE